MFKGLKNIKKYILLNKKIIMISIGILIIIPSFTNKIFMNDGSLKEITDQDRCAIIFIEVLRKPREKNKVYLSSHGRKSKGIILDLKNSKELGEINYDDEDLPTKIVDYEKNTKELTLISSLSSVAKYNVETRKSSYIDFDDNKSRAKYISDALDIEDKRLETHPLLVAYRLNVYYLNFNDSNIQNNEYNFYEKKFKIKREMFDNLKTIIKRNLYTRRKSNFYIENFKKLNENKYFVKIGYAEEGRLEGIEDIKVRDYIYDSTINTLTPLANYLVNIKDKDIWLETYVNDRWTNFEYVERFIKERSDIDVYDILLY